MSGVDGAGRESPIGDDENEEVRQRAGCALILIFRFHTTFSLHKQHILMHLPQRTFSSPNLQPMVPATYKHDLTHLEQLGSENQDYCSSCGGSGYLLCCDGCDRAFHFACVDPPLNPDAEELDEPWYCNICVAKRPIGPESPEKPTRGLFSFLISDLKKRNPTNFVLPEGIKNYFEGVSSDKNGAFVESMNATKNTRYASRHLTNRELRLTQLAGAVPDTQMTSQTTTDCVTARVVWSCAMLAASPHKSTRSPRSDRLSLATTAHNTGTWTASTRLWPTHPRSTRMARRSMTGCVRSTLTRSCKESTSLCSIATIAALFICASLECQRSRKSRSPVALSTMASLMSPKTPLTIPRASSTKRVMTPRAPCSSFQPKASSLTSSTKSRGNVHHLLVASNYANDITVLECSNTTIMSSLTSVRVSPPTPLPLFQAP